MMPSAPSEVAENSVYRKHFHLTRYNLNVVLQVSIWFFAATTVLCCYCCFCCFAFVIVIVLDIVAFAVVTVTVIFPGLVVVVVGVVCVCV